MKIKQLYITDFSGTENREINLGDSINILEGKNESGKSTIGAFIKFMLYGFEDKQERIRFYSWGHTSASGTMTVETKRGEYRIERSYSEADGDKVSVINLLTNTTERSVTSPGEYFLGVNARVFASTAFTGQSKSRIETKEKLGGAIENMLFSGDESTTTEKALKKLDEARIRLLYKNKKGGLIYNLTEEQDSLRASLDGAIRSNSELLEKENALRETKDSIAQLQKQIEDASHGLEYYNAAEKFRKIALYDEFEEKIRHADEQYSYFKARQERNSFYPSREMIANLQSLDRQAQEFEEEYNRANFDLAEHNSKAFEENIILAQTELVNSHGGEEGIHKTIETFERKQFRFSVLKTLFVVIAVLFAAIFILAFTSDILAPFADKLNVSTSTIGLGSLAASLLMIILAVLFFFLTKLQITKLNEFFSGFGVDDKDDIDDIISKLGCSHVLMTMHKTKTEELTAKLASVTEKLNGVREEIRKITEPCSCTTTREAIPVILKALSDEEALIKEKEKYLLARDTVGKTISLDERQELLDIIAGRPYSEDSFDKERIEQEKRKIASLESSLRSLREKANALETEIAVLSATAESPSLIADKLMCVTREIDEQKRKHSALCLAYESLSLASDNLRSQIAPKLSRISGEIMSELTNGKYKVIGVDGNLQMEYRARDGRTHSIDYMSYGTRELAYISLRIALAEVLFPKEQSPAIFDESFSCIDDARLAEMFGILAKSAENGMQILLFTSQGRDSVIAEKAEVGFNRILLD